MILLSFYPLIRSFMVIVIFLFSAMHNYVYATTSDMTNTALEAKQELYKLSIVVSTIWHGDHIFPHNLQAIKQIRQQFPMIRIWHFISPNYFLIADEEEQKRRANLIQSSIQEGDHIGLYLEARPKLLDKAGVLFRARPSFYRGEAAHCENPMNCQHDAILSIYPNEDLLKIITTSKNVLQAHGFSARDKYMNRFWEGDSQITKAAIQLGFRQDYSAIPPSKVGRRLGNAPGFSWLEANWNRLEQGLAQPYWRKFRTGRMLVIPQSAGVIDYSTTDEVIGSFRENLANLATSQRQILVLQLAFHQETALMYRPRIEKTLRQIIEIAEQKQAKVIFQLPRYH